MSKTFRHPKTAVDSRCGSDACPACRRAHLRKQARPLQAAVDELLDDDGVVARISQHTLTKLCRMGKRAVRPRPTKHLSNRDVTV
ncbi:MAG: hypothetical protein OT477_16070 [Chloroflexi bacterium]|nr:hypothetical protein [Chloroflexota bacterium]